FQRQTDGRVNLLAAADFGTHFELARRENHVNLLVEDQHGEQPEEKQDAGDEEVTAGVDANVEITQMAQDVFPPAGQGEDNRQRDNDEDHHERPHAAQRHVGDDDDQQQDGGEQDAKVLALGNVQAKGF